MKAVNISAGMRSLSECLQQIKSLLAWADLVDAEGKRRTLLSFRIDHHTEDDLRNQCGFFLKTAMDLHEILNDEGQTSLSLAVQSRLKKRLLRLEEDFGKLNLTERFIKV